MAYVHLCVCVCLQGYKELYSKKWAYTQELAISIDGGLQKMNEAKADVNKMKAELAIKNQELAVAAKEAEALLKQVRTLGLTALPGASYSAIQR